MPDLKVLIGGRNYKISCNPGEENATIESARLFDKEAELIQGQIGRLSEDKMLLLSGLLLGNKIVELQSEKKVLEEKLARTESSVKESSFKNDDHQQVKTDQSNVSNANDLAFEREKNQFAFIFCNFFFGN